MKKTNKLIGILLALVMVFTLTVFAACGKTERVEGSAGLKYTLSDDGSYYILTSFGDCKDTDVVVGNWHEDKPVKEIDHHVFASLDLEGTGVELTSVTVSEGIEVLGECWCSNMSVKKVVLPDGIEALGVGSFLLGGNLQSIVIGKGLKSIEADAFEKVSQNVKIYFRGTEAEWKAVTVADRGNDLLPSLTVVYDYEG